MNRLQVYVHDKQTGIIIRGGAGLWAGSADADFTFIYDETADENSAVSVMMPVYRGFYPGDGQLHPIFDMNLPEGRLREEIRLRFAKATEDFDNLALLGIVGGTTIGRLRYGAGGLGQDPSESAECNLAEIMSYSGSEDLLTYLLQRYATHSGVAGVQPKVLVQDTSRAGLSDEAMKKISFRDATHIIKAWEQDYPQLAANEFFCMQAAAKAGLTVPKIELSQNGKLLGVSRFDLDRDSGRYLGFEDFCALSGFPSGGKYYGSYERLAKGLRKFLIGETLRQAQHDYFKMVALNCIIRNGDAHLKNFGILYDSPEIENRSLAPAYDIVTTTAYIPRDTMALTLNDTKRWPDRQALVTFGQQSCELPRTTINHIMEQALDAVTGTRHSIQEYAGDHPEFKTVGERMLQVWDEGVDMAR